MGNWAAPSNTEKAKALAAVMENPIPQRQAYDMLYSLTGDDDLFNKFDEVDADTDIRYLVVFKLEEWLESLDTFFKPWDKDAIRICNDIIKKHQD